MCPMALSPLEARASSVCRQPQGTEAGVFSESGCEWEETVMVVPLGGLGPKQFFFSF